LKSNRNWRTKAQAELSNDLPAVGRWVVTPGPSPARSARESNRVSRDGAREHGFEGLGRAQRSEHGRPRCAGQRGSNQLHDDGQGTISTASRAGSPATPLHYAPFGRRVNSGMVQ
jgi:hypothetical protein